MRKNLRIVFLGNPEFARYHLEKILDNGFNVVGVISAPDKRGGRGMKLLSTPVTQYARKKNIKCLQPKNLKSADFQEELASLNADLQVVIAFRILPVAVWDMPPLGTYNLHASLLPQYRGAAPINWAIINGETETGVSTFKLKHEIDTGNLIIQKKCQIETNDTAGTLHDKLMHLGAESIVETLEQLAIDAVVEQPQQDSDSLKSAPKLYTENTRIDWRQKGTDIVNLVRGLCPYPAAHSLLDNKKILIYGVHFQEIEHSHPKGTYTSDYKKVLGVYVSNGIIWLDDIKLQGKKRMGIIDFINGYDSDHLTLFSSIS